MQGEPRDRPAASATSRLPGCGSGWATPASCSVREDIAGRASRRRRRRSAGGGQRVRGTGRTARRRRPRVTRKLSPGQRRVAAAPRQRLDGRRRRASAAARAFSNSSRAFGRAETSRAHARGPFTRQCFTYTVAGRQRDAVDGALRRSCFTTSAAPSRPARGPGRRGRTAPRRPAGRASGPAGGQLRGRRSADRACGARAPTSCEHAAEHQSLAFLIRSPAIGPARSAPAPPATAAPPPRRCSCSSTCRRPPCPAAAAAPGRREPRARPRTHSSGRRREEAGLAVADHLAPARRPGSRPPAARPPGTGAPSARTCRGSSGRRAPSRCRRRAAAISAASVASLHGTASTGRPVEREEAVADQLQPRAGDRAADGVEQRAEPLQPLQRAGRADPHEPHRRRPARAPRAGSAAGSTQVGMTRDAVGGESALRLVGEEVVAGDHRVARPARGARTGAPRRRSSSPFGEYESRSQTASSKSKSSCRTCRRSRRQLPAGQQLALQDDGVGVRGRRNSGRARPAECAAAARTSSACPAAASAARNAASR